MMPLVHLNGSSAESLIEANIAAAKAVRRAITALSEAYPNGRDFYPRGDDAIYVAMKEHGSRLDRLISVASELEAIAMNVDGQESARTNHRAV